MKKGKTDVSLDGENAPEIGELPPARRTPTPGDQGLTRVLAVLGGLPDSTDRASFAYAPHFGEGGGVQAR